MQAKICIDRKVDKKINTKSGVTMLKRKNKKIQCWAATLTLIFAFLTISTLFFRSEDSKEAHYTGIKPNGQLVALKLKDAQHANF